MSLWTAYFLFLATGRASGRGETTEGGSGGCDDGADAVTEHPREGAHQVLTAGIAAWTTFCANSLCLCARFIFPCNGHAFAKRYQVVRTLLLAAAAACPTKQRPRSGLLYAAALLCCCRGGLASARCTLTVTGRQQQHCFAYSVHLGVIPYNHCI